jgi:hypothetical protein
MVTNRSRGAIILLRETSSDVAPRICQEVPAFTNKSANALDCRKGVARAKPHSNIAMRHMYNIHVRRSALYCGHRPATPPDDRLDQEINHHLDSSWHHGRVCCVQKCHTEDKGPIA